jgi:hypothetical protein
MLTITFRTENDDTSGRGRTATRLASEIVVLILTRRAGEHHAATPGRRQERNRVKKPLAEIPTMS